MIPIGYYMETRESSFTSIDVSCAGKLLSGGASELAVSLIELEHGSFELDMDVIDSIR